MLIMHHRAKLKRGDVFFVNAIERENAEPKFGQRNLSARSSQPILEYPINAIHLKLISKKLEMLEGSSSMKP